MSDSVKIQRAVSWGDADPRSSTTTVSDEALSGASAEIERLDVARLGAMLRNRRGSLSLRQAAADANVSFSTFSRVESGSQPDLTSFMLLCAWLGVPPSDFFASIAPREKTPMDEAISHIASDPRLAPDAADKIVDLLRTMYTALAHNVVGPPVVACHLRAASVLRPGVPERLNTLLASMNAELERRVAAGEI